MLSDTEPEPALAIKDLTFSYGRGVLRRRQTIFDGFSWDVPAGVRTALLGPNGAGKSTLLKLMAGSLRPRRGSVRSASGETPRETVALMPQDVHVLPGVTVRDQVAYAGWLAGLSRRDAVSKADQVVDQVELSEQADEYGTRLSGGQRRRLGLAEVLASPSEVLLLDEPTAGLDPAQRQVFHRLLGSDTLARRTVVVSTHQLEDLDSTFDRVAILSRGRLLLDAPVAEFQAAAWARGQSVQEAFSSLVDGGLH